jgi:hypothetical protein
MNKLERSPSNAASVMKDSSEESTLCGGREWLTSEQGRQLLASGAATRVGQAPGVMYSR